MRVMVAILATVITRGVYLRQEIGFTYIRFIHFLAIVVHICNYIFIIYDWFV